ncbi:hypothetical protein MHYP_G00224560 [Metynnis hypsauchen]
MFGVFVVVMMSVEVNQNNRPIEAQSHKQVSPPGWREDDGCCEGGEQERCQVLAVLEERDSVYGFRESVGDAGLTCGVLCFLPVELHGGFQVKRTDTNALFILQG